DVSPQSPRGPLATEGRPVLDAPLDGEQRQAGDDDGADERQDGEGNSNPEGGHRNTSFVRTPSEERQPLGRSPAATGGTRRRTSSRCADLLLVAAAADRRARTLFGRRAAVKRTSVRALSWVDTTGTGVTRHPRWQAAEGRRRGR